MKKTETAICILLACILLCACGNSDAKELHFDLDFFGECTASDGAVLCVGNGKITAYSLSGDSICSISSTLSDAHFSSSGDYALMYDGQELYLFDRKEIKHNILKNKIMLTDVNKFGYTAVCTSEAGYKGCVTVFDDKSNPAYKLYCASGYLIKAVISEKNTLAVLTAKEEGSTVNVYCLDSEIEKYSVFIKNELIFDVSWMGERLCLLSENGAYFAENDDYDEVLFDGTLGEYALGTELGIFEIQNRYGTSELHCYNEKGKREGSFECDTVENIAVYEDKAAVLCGGRAVLLNKKMKELISYDGRGVRQLMLTDGTMLLLRDCELTVIKYNP